MSGREPAPSQLEPVQSTGTEPSVEESAPEAGSIPRYVFIVGLPRTGSKLVKLVLANARGVSFRFTGENFFFGHFIRKGVRHAMHRLGPMSQDENVRRFVDLLYSDKMHGTYFQQLQDGTMGVPKERLVQMLLATDRSDRSIYDAMLRVHAGDGEQVVIGNKTPGNLHYVPDILEWFPDARIVHTFRDPRAIVASEWLRRSKKHAHSRLGRVAMVPTLVRVVLHMTILWRRACTLHHRYRTDYPENYHHSRFEDLVAAPEARTRELCEFLGIDFDPQMLEPRQVGSSFRRGGGRGFDRETLTRWKKRLPRWAQLLVRLGCGKRFVEFGYPVEFDSQEGNSNPGDLQRSE